MNSAPGHRIWWIASYPKSGNTWTRILLANYLNDRDQPVDINELDAATASARAFFDDHVGIEASDLTQDEIDRYRPAAYEEAVQRATQPIYLKVHDAFVKTAGGLPLFPASASGGAIYLLRNPLDVAVSFAHHAAVAVDTAVGWMSDPACCLAAETTGIHPQLRQQLLTWSGHVTSWIDAQAIPIHVMRYEDLRADTAGTLTRALSFLGLNPDPVRVAKAVTFSSFDQLQAQERARGFVERMPVPGVFFRAGTSGSWRTEMPPALADAIIREHGEVMRRFGYLSANNEPVG